MNQNFTAIKVFYLRPLFMFCFFVCLVIARYITNEKKYREIFGRCERVLKSTHMISELELSYHLIVGQQVLYLKPVDLNGGMANSRPWPRKSALAGADRSGLL